jgi:hypothetical protein
LDLMTKKIELIVLFLTVRDKNGPSLVLQI